MVIFPGIVTAGGTELVFYVPLGAPVLASAATITGRFLGHVGSGYMAKASLASPGDFAAMDVTVTPRLCGLSVKVTDPDGWGETNNSNVAVRTINEGLTVVFA